jgi:hypothetical protein
MMQKVSKVKRRKQMKCTRPVSDLIFYAEGTLNTEKIPEIELHLSDCTMCKEFLESVKTALSYIESDKVIEVNPYFYTRVESRMQSMVTHVPVSFKRFIPALVAATIFIGGVLTGINIGKLLPVSQYKSEEALTQERKYLDELDQESIETFFLTTNGGENE